MIPVFTYQVFSVLNKNTRSYCRCFCLKVIVLKAVELQRVNIKIGD